MFPTRMFLVAAALFAATPAVAQPQPLDSRNLELTSTLVVEADLVSEQPVATLGGEEFEPTSHPVRLGWREDEQRTANRARARGSRGATPVRVVRACEVSLRLGDEDCAGN